MKIVISAVLAIAMAFTLNAEAAKKKAVPARDISSVKTFSCSGTEPFWSLEISGNNATFELAGDKKASFKTTGIRQAAGMSEGNVMSVQSSNLKNVITMMSSDLVGSKCSDGMSDNEYAFHSVYVTPGTTYTGCCTIK